MLWSYDFFQFTIPALYLVTDTTQVIKVFIVFPVLSFDLNIYFFPGHIISTSVILRYLYPVSLMPLMLLLSESCIIRSLLLGFSLC